MSESLNKPLHTRDCCNTQGSVEINKASFPTSGLSQTHSFPSPENLHKYSISKAEGKAWSRRP